MEKGKKLYRSRTDKAIAGVCGGLAEYFGIDSIVIRLLWVILVFVFGSGILAYIIAALIIPKEPEGGVYAENMAPGSYTTPDGRVYTNKAAGNNVYEQTYDSSSEPAEVKDADFTVVEDSEITSDSTEVGRPSSQNFTFGGYTQPEENKEPQGVNNNGPKPAGDGYYEAGKNNSATYNQYGQAKKPSPSKKSGSDTGKILGIALILLGAFLLLKIFMPAIDTRIVFAILIIAAGVFLIFKK